MLRFPDGSLQPVQHATDPDGREYLLAGNSGLAPLGWTTVEVVEPGGPADSPAMTVAEQLLENEFWRIELNDAGQFVRLADKRAGREVLASGQPANQLQLFRDRPTANFAWNIDYHDILKPTAVLAAERVEVVEAGPVRGALRLHFSFGRSRLAQDIRIYRDIERIDLACWCDWHEEDVLLKAAFPVDVFCPEATYEIQFGAIRRPTHRNTSWDLARFEAPAQRWIDLSESGYGVSLLNDCKYGHDVAGNVMRVSLLRGPLRSRENTRADQGEHRFTYSLLPHRGDWRQSTIAHAAQLNMPIHACALAGSGGKAGPPADALPGNFSLVRADNPAFVISTIKKAEDDDRLIVRGYESHGGRGPVTLHFGRAVRAAWRSRADERVHSPLRSAGRSVTIDIRPFEVVTLKVDLGEL